MILTLKKWASKRLLLVSYEAVEGGWSEKDRKVVGRLPCQMSVAPVELRSCERRCVCPICGMIWLCTAGYRSYVFTYRYLQMKSLHKQT